jgi:hypothetical protein
MSSGESMYQTVVFVVVAVPVEWHTCSMVALRGLKGLDEARKFVFLQVSVMCIPMVLVL